MRNLISCWAVTLVLANTATPLAAQDNKPKPPPAAQAVSAMGWTGVLSEADFAALHQLKADKAPKPRGKMIEIGSAKAYLSMPKGGKPTAAVLLIHEWWGLNSHIKHWADRLASDGYATLAIDLYGGVVATTREEALASMRSVDADAALVTLKAAHAFLAGPKVGAKQRACIGWCFGGGWSLKLAMAAPDLDAAVIYYGRLVTEPKKLAGIGAPVLGIFADKDRGIPPTAVTEFAKAMKSAGKPLQLRRYDANHAFANPSSARYAKEHAADAWDRVRIFLGEHLAPDNRRANYIVDGKPVWFVIPKGWGPAAQRPLRSVNLTVAEGIECHVTVLGGDGGGLDANVGRWCGQMGAKGLSEDQIDGLPRIEMIGKKASLVVIDGTFSDRRGARIEDARMMAAVCKLTHSTVFVKFIGAKKLVAKHELAFRIFCTSMRRTN